MSGRPYDPNEGLPGLEPDEEPSVDIEQSRETRPPEQVEAEQTVLPDSSSAPAEDKAETELRDRVERNDLDYEDLPGLEGMSTYDLTADWTSSEWTAWFAREVEGSSLWKRYLQRREEDERGEEGTVDGIWEEVATNPATGKPDPDLLAADPDYWEEGPHLGSAGPGNIGVLAHALMGGPSTLFGNYLDYETKVKFYKGWYRVTEAAAAQESRESEPTAADSTGPFGWTSTLTKGVAAVGAAVVLAGALVAILGNGNTDDQVTTTTIVEEEAFPPSTVFEDEDTPNAEEPQASPEGESRQRLSPLLVDPCVVISSAAIEGFAGFPMSGGEPMVSPSSEPFDPEKTRRAICRFESDGAFGLWAEVQRGERGFFENFQERNANAIATSGDLGFGDFGELRVLADSKNVSSTLYEGTYVTLQVHYLDESQTGGVFILVETQTTNADAPYASTEVQESTVRAIAAVLWDELVAAQEG